MTYQLIKRGDTLKKYLILSKRHLIIFITLLLLLAIIIYSLTNKEHTKTVASTQRLLPIYCTEQSEKKISISFDAAWGNEDTEELISILNKYKIKAKFFLVGEWVDKYPESVKALHDAGMEIANHSDKHPNMIKLSKEEMKNEIVSCNEKIKQITGYSPTLFRAPYGSYNNSLIEMLNSLNMYCIQWDVDSLDWKDLSADQIYNKVTKKVKDGSIVLFHNAALHTPEALPSIIESLKSDGYEFVPISELIYKENFYIDHSGKQILNQ